MQVVRTVDALREALEGARSGTIGFVPTMGALHEGHLSLVGTARDECDTVVLSIFVNPTQFNDAADLLEYPRDEERDTELAAAAGVDLVFAPAASEMYPERSATTVSVAGHVTETFEAAGRGRGHFNGMATIVTKLFIACMPHRAYFGAKDAQQAIVVRQFVRDLRLPLEIVVCPTSRDADGLARSSRNVHLSDAERQRALGIPRALVAAETLFQHGETNADRLIAEAAAVLAHHDVEPEYLAVARADTLESVATVDRASLMLVAARVGETRLIDNTPLTPGED